MSGSAALDQQIAQAMTPRYNPRQAIQQRQPVRQVQNPVFGGAIQMEFGLPQQGHPAWMTQQSVPYWMVQQVTPSWMPQTQQYQAALSGFKPRPFDYYTGVAKQKQELQDFINSAPDSSLMWGIPDNSGNYTNIMSIDQLSALDKMPTQGEWVQPVTRKNVTTYVPYVPPSGDSGHGGA